MDRKVSPGEVCNFLDDLAAAPARHDRFIPAGYLAFPAASNGDGYNPIHLAIAAGLGNGDSFRTECQAIAGIFEIGTSDNATVIKQQGCPDMEV